MLFVSKNNKIRSKFYCYFFKSLRGNFSLTPEKWTKERKVKTKWEIVKMLNVCLLRAFEIFHLHTLQAPRLFRFDAFQWWDYLIFLRFCRSLLFSFFSYFNGRSPSLSLAFYFSFVIFSFSFIYFFFFYSQCIFVFSTYSFKFASLSIYIYNFFFSFHSNERANFADCFKLVVFWWSKFFFHFQMNKWKQFALMIDNN